jgi:hypothetical protein
MPVCSRVFASGLRATERITMSISAQVRPGCPGSITRRRSLRITSGRKLKSLLNNSSRRA